MAAKFEETLNECVDRLLRGESLEDCLRSHPEHAEQLEPLLRTALTAQKAAYAEARPEFKARLRYEVASRASASARPRAAPHFGWAARWAVAVVSIFLLFVMAGGSTVAAASSSVPGDTLYSVKTTSERAWLAVTFSDTAKAKLQARFAARRVQEMARLAERGQLDGLHGLSARVDAHLGDLSQLAAGIKATDPEAPQIAELEGILQRNMTRDLAVLEAAEESVPPEDWPALELARNRLANSYQGAFNALSGKQGGEESPDAGDTSGSGGASSPSDGGTDGYGSMPGAGFGQFTFALY